MADFKTSLNGKNYPTWKLQCRMALVKNSLWDIVTGTEQKMQTLMQETNSLQEVIVLLLSSYLR